MAIQTTMGQHSDVHFSRRALYWTLGVIVALFLAIGFAMSRNSRMSAVSDRTSVQDTRAPAGDSNGVNRPLDGNGYQRSSPPTDGSVAQ